MPLFIAPRPEGGIRRLGLIATLATLIAACSEDPSPPKLVDGGDDTAADDTAVDDTEIEEVPSRTAPWLRQEIATPGSITFDEIMFHPNLASDEEDLEWIELFNPMALDMDLSGWSIAGGVTFSFVEGTILPARGYLVVAADPGRLADDTGFAEALGPFEGSLSNGGERIDLFNNAGRLIDTVEYGDDDPWPVQADGSGLTLAKMTPHAASDHAESWTVSAELGGTPGRANLLDPLAFLTRVELVSSDATWSYDLSGEYPAKDWAEPSHDDHDWERAPAPFFVGASEESLPAIVRASADNYLALYLGSADASDLRFAGQDSDGDWTTVETLDLEVGPQDHLYLAAWESPVDWGGPQMVIAEIELPDELVGTSASGFEWILGPADASPDATPPDAPPTEEEIRALVEEAEGAWELPAVEAVPGSDPWGWALGSLFDEATRYIWADTFGDPSLTNTENTFALFRSIEPLQASRGATELPVLPTTITFRTTFSLDADPSSAELGLDCLLDDGAVFYLNGVEVHRTNMPLGPVSSDTLASAPTEDATSLYAELPATSLTRGLNLLAVELHQAELDDPDMTFGCTLVARVSAEPAAPTILLNEVPPATDAPFWVELYDASGSGQEADGLVLASSEGDEIVLPSGTFEPGGLLSLDDVDLPVESGDVLFLYSSDRARLLDAVRLRETPRARDLHGGPWYTPSEATPGETNLIALQADVVIHEIQYHRAPASSETKIPRPEAQGVAKAPGSARAEEWIELYNQGTKEVDLGGWQLVDAVTFTFPSGTSLAPGAFLVVTSDASAMRAEYPKISVTGDFSGRLDNAGDRILLLDALGNPADEVRYFDDGRWPSAADGEGSTLELRHPRADNAAAESWAASDESARTAWVSYRYRGVADPSAVGPDGTWDELVLGLLGAGEILIDDLSVILEPDAAGIEVLQNGSFDAGDTHWRLLGNHRHSEIVPDPDDPANPVLRLVATGPTGHMHNHAETTLLQPVRPRTYEVSFRARWVSGSDQLNARLYFNRLPRTIRVARPERAGTPGEQNSRYEANPGPTFEDLRQDVAVPAPNEPVELSVLVQDPDGVASVTLWSSVGGLAFQDQPMTMKEPGLWSAWLDGESAGSVVQFYVEALDDLGAQAFFPAAGPDSRALIRFDDGLADTSSPPGLHNLRILMSSADSEWLHEDVNLMSDDLLGATAVYDESEIFYDVGLRAKGSERGRPETLRLGYGIRFQRERPFRGYHTSVLIDRSEGVQFGQREVLLNLAMTHAGSVSGEYNDLIHAITPLREHTGPAELQLDRQSDLVLAAQFEDGDQGALFEYELIYYPLTTDNGTDEGLKLPQPDGVIGTSLRDLGSDPESYRWNFLLGNNEREDDYERLIELCQTFGLATPDFLDQVGEVIDTDQWLRAFAFATLAGAVDQYGGDGSQHNARFYLRPEDQRMLYFPHDLDFFGYSTMPVVGNADLARLLEDPVNERSFYGHLQDIIERSYNSGYLGRWCEQLGALLPGQDFDSHCRFVDERADWVMRSAPDAVLSMYPAIGFDITTADGLSVKAPEVLLEGQGWIDVHAIALAGMDESLEVSWLEDQRWQVTVPLEKGENKLILIALDLRGQVVGGDSILVQRAMP